MIPLKRQTPSHRFHLELFILAFSSCLPIVYFSVKFFGVPTYHSSETIFAKFTFAFFIAKTIGDTQSLARLEQQISSDHSPFERSLLWYLSLFSPQAIPLQYLFMAPFPLTTTKMIVLTPEAHSSYFYSCHIEFYLDNFIYINTLENYFQIYIYIMPVFRRFF